MTRAAERVRARDLFYGPEKLRALWRLLLFLVCAAAALFVLGSVASLIVPEDYGGLWAIVVPHGLMAVARGKEKIELSEELKKPPSDLNT